MLTPTLIRPPLRPFSRESAIQKVRVAEDAWNSRDPEKVALAYTIESGWSIVLSSQQGGKKSERNFHWPLGRRPERHPELSNLEL